MQIQQESLCKVKQFSPGHTFCEHLFKAPLCFVMFLTQGFQKRLKKFKKYQEFCGNMDESPLFCCQISANPIIFCKQLLHSLPLFPGLWSVLENPIFSELFLCVGHSLRLNAEVFARAWLFCVLSCGGQNYLKGLSFLFYMRFLKTSYIFSFFHLMLQSQLKIKGFPQTMDYRYLLFLVPCLVSSIKCPPPHNNMKHNTNWNGDFRPKRFFLRSVDSCSSFPLFPYVQFILSCIRPQQDL